MKQGKFILLFIFNVLIVTNYSFGQSEANSVSIKLVNIKVNNENVTLYRGSVVIDTNDALSIEYQLVSEDSSNRPDFFYKVSLIDGIDTSVTNSGLNISKFSRIQVGHYYLIVSAFGLKKKLQVNPLKIQIIVDPNLAKLWKENKIIAENLKKQKDTLTAKTNKNTELSSTLLVILQNPLTTIIIAVLFLIIGYLSFYLVNRKKINQFNKIKSIIEQRGKSMSTVELAPLTKDEYEKLLSENGSLKAEIASMKGQIDAMIARSNELSSRNKELENKLELLSKSKNDLEELSTQKDELFAIVIHDIKNPAALIKNLVDLLRSYDLTANEQQEIIEDIAETTQRIVQLSQEVTKILSIESSLMNLNIEKTPLKYVIEDVVTRNKVAAANKKMSLFAEIDSNLPDVEIDANKIDEVLDNLISNAIKFTQEGGTIRVKAYKELKDIIVEVSDNGLGLSEDDVAKAFRRGQKLSTKPTGNENSTGMGLWIVKKIIDAHHGKVWIKSALGKGSTFAFTIPQIQPEKIK
jgi:signal transduction histidine kinase